MTYESFVKELAGVLQWDRFSARAAVDEAFLLIARHVFERGDELRVPGIGTFYRRRRKAHEVPPLPNRETGRLEIPAQFSLRFRPAKNMRRNL